MDWQKWIYDSFRTRFYCDWRRVKHITKNDKNVGANIFHSEGVFGLWINSELEKGYSQACPTFDNERLTPNPEFECVELEVWGFRI